MLFSSYIFIFIFLPIVFFSFFGISRFHLFLKARLLRSPTASPSDWLTYQRWLIALSQPQLVLVIASLAFYGYWNVNYLPLLLFSIVINYILGEGLLSQEKGSAKANILIILALAFNLGLIAYYKYSFFLATNFLHDTNFKWLDGRLNLSEVVLPLAISFFTFQQISYQVDIYSGRRERYSFLDYCLFVTFFPQLIAGPIVRHSEILPQFQNLKAFLFQSRNFSLGVTAFTIGLAKKILIADNLSGWVGPVFSHTADAGFLEAWVGAISYTFQLYFDFSGYSDMAIGLGLLFNIHLPINFDSPYKSKSISEFWRRWHITLSHFLRDYLYIPLGGNRKGNVRHSINLMITMLLGGLWHGAGWTFVVWGGIHGCYLAIHHNWRRLNLKLPGQMAWLITFLGVVGGWVIFRSNNLSDASHLLQSMVGLNGVTLPEITGNRFTLPSTFGFQFKPIQEFTYLPVIQGNRLAPLIFLIALIGAVRYLPNTNELIQRFQPTWIWAAWLGIMGGFCILSLGRVSEFLYFQF